MSTKNTRSGGKFSGSHSTVIDAATIVADIAEKLPEVTKISLGFISSSLRPINGKRRVKITDRDGNVLLAVRDNTSHQEITVYTNDIQETKHAIARGARDEGLRISFGNKK